MEIARGGSPRPIKAFLTEESNGVNWIKIGDTEKGGKYINQAREKIKPEGVSKSRLVHKGDFLLTNSMSFGRPYILNVDGCIHDGWLVLSDNFKAFDKDFLYYLLSSKFAYYQFCESVSGAVVKNLNSDKVAISRFAIPPINEQKRIANKIESLVPLIEKYEKFENELYELNSNIKGQLKKSILQYAIEGKLVPQDPNDEPASVLLDRIRKEKQKLIAEGKIKKDKNESIIYRRDNSYYEKLNGIERCIEEEIPYIIPDSWEWIRLGNALINRDSERIPLSVSERAKLKKIYDYYGASGVIDKVDKYLFDKPLLLVGEDGANLILRSKPIAFIANGKYWVNNHAHVLDSCSDLLLEYVEIYINSLNLSPYVTGTAQPKMNQEKMNSILIPIPPYNEQKRIISESKKIYSILK